MTDNGHFAYTWDIFGRLTSATDMTWEYGDPQPEYVIYLYDALGRRVARRYYGADAPYYGDFNEWKDVRIVHDGVGPISEHYLDNGNLHERCYYEGLARPFMVDNGDVGLEGRGLLLTDDRGTVAGVVDWDNPGYDCERLYYNTTGLCRSYMGSLFGGGENLRADDPDYNLGRSYGTPFGYLGMYKDRFTGLYHTHFREYDAVHGRWLSEDPAGYADGLNLYQAYMGVNGTDPLGLESLIDLLADDKLTVGEIQNELELTPDEIEAILSSQNAIKKTGSEADRLRRAKLVLLFRNPSWQQYVTEMYSFTRSMNPVHFCAEKGYAIGSGYEPILGNKVDRLWTTAELGLYLVTIYGGEKGMGMLKSQCFKPAPQTQAALTGTAAEEAALSSKAVWVGQQLTTASTQASTAGVSTIVSQPMAFASTESVYITGSSGAYFNSFLTTPTSYGIQNYIRADMQAAATRAVNIVGPGKGPAYGTKVHSVFETEVNALGNSNLTTEVSYLNGRVVPRGTAFSVRVDAVEGPINNPVMIYDLKTGGARLTPARIQEIQSHIPGGSIVPVIEVRPGQ